MRAKSAVTHSTRGSRLRSRYWQTGRLEDLKEAVGEYRKAVSLTLIDEPELPGRLNNLGNGLRDLYRETTGHEEYLEEAVRVSCDAVRLTPPTHHHLLSLCLNDLGDNLLALYGRTNNLEDLEKTIDTFREAHQVALRLVPFSDLPELPFILRNLSDALLRRYDRIGDVKDLDEAVLLSQEALNLNPHDALEDRADILSNLGVVLLLRHWNSPPIEYMETLDKPIQCFREALCLLPIKSPLRASILTHLADALIECYLYTYRSQYLEEAINCSQEAACLTSIDSRYRPIVLKKLKEHEYHRYVQVVNDFLGADTWIESCRVVEKHPELLSDGADALLNSYVTAAEKNGDLGSYHIHKRHRHLLQVCRVAGIESW